jgi:hypothetical protein
VNAGILPGYAKAQKRLPLIVRVRVLSGHEVHIAAMAVTVY